SILRSGRPWVIPLAVALIAVICFSRMVLGVHFPQDIIGGLILGGVVLFIFMRSIDSILGWYESLSTGRKIGYSLVVSWILIALAIILRSLLNHEDPDTWKIMATLAEGVDVSDVASLKKAFDPRSLDPLITIAGTLAGVGVSLALSERSNHFRIIKKPAAYVGIFLLGFIGLVIFRELPKKIFPFEDEILAGIVRYGRYFITMLWAVYWAPMLFKSLGWAEPLPDNEMKTFLQLENKQ
ncbi:MAG: phosphatase PAP2 family protein, partial [Leptospiraceae bacterium]|nr:phosphatase PAP2 family protein [Leptospiraceae bacterium]